jgi:DNA polymerase III delta prime subunit
MNNELDIHQNITEKLDFFIKVQKIPNILFHGPSGSGKRTIVYNFVDRIYNNDKIIKQANIMFVNCAQGKGIKFIRDDLKFFAKTHINFKNGNFFKTVILSNADKLTIDAQSALRRCIELFSHTTRFFIIVEDKYKLLRPILSRFSEIYIPLPLYEGYPINLHRYNIKSEISPKLNSQLKRTLVKLDNPIILYELSQKIYDKGITGLDLINYINATYKNNSYKFKLLIVIQKVRRELRGEKLIILFILNLLASRSETDLENILDM